VKVDVPVRYVGFDIPNEFVVGYGLDFAERYREVPFIGVLDRRSTPGCDPHYQGFLGDNCGFAESALEPGGRGGRHRAVPAPTVYLRMTGCHDGDPG
jgi:hypothetical protein